MPDKITEAFKSIKSSNLFLDEQDFREQLQKAPKDVFSLVKDDGLFLDYDDFETSLDLKKNASPKATSSVPSSATLSPLEIPRPQGQSEKVRVEAGAVSDKQVDPTKLGSFLPQDRTSAPKTDLAATLTQARQTAKLMEEKPLIKERQQVVKREAFDNTLKAYSKGKKLSQAQLDTKAKELDKMLSEGKLQIAKDPTTGKRILAYKDENFFTSFFDSAKRVEANRLLNKRISDASLPEKIKIVEEENQKEAEYLPELPSGAFGSLGEWGAGLTTPLIRPVGYGLAAVGAATMLNAPAAYTAAANTVGSTIAFVEDMMYSGRAETFRRVYNGLLKDKPNATEQEKMEAAKQADEASLKSAAVGAGEAILFGVPFSRFAKLEQSAIGYKSKLEGIAKHTLEESPKAALIMGSGATGRAAIAKEAGAEDVDILSEGLEAAKGGVEMVAGFGILKTIPHAMGVLARTIVPPSKSITSQAKAVVSELPREEVIRIYEEGERQGVFEEGTAKRVAEELKSYDEAKAAVPETVQKSETQDALAGKLEAKFKKEKELAETKIESRKKEIQEEIAQIDKDIDAIYEGKPIEEHEYDVTGKKLSELKPVEFEEQITTEEQFKEPLVETVEDKTGLILYHGTPHSFEKFDISKLGTGEGQQAFGHGLYFTNKKSIAEGYANNLSSKKKFWEALMDGNEISLTKEDFDFINSELDSLGFDGSRAEMENLGNVKVDGKDEYSPYVLEALAVLFGKNAKSVLKEDYGLSDSEVERMIQIKKKISDPQLYTISLHKGKSASEYDYLDWHGALSDKQKKKIGDVSGNSGEEVYKNLSKKLGGDKAASDYLLSKGIDGIVYKSERGTGGADGKGRNYVVFDEKSIVIEDINGEKISTNLEESKVIPLQEQQKSQDITLQKEDWSKDVESTAKALEGKDILEIEKYSPTYLNREDITKIENNKTKITRIKPQKGDVFRGVERGKLIPDYVFFVSENPRVAEEYTRAENTSGKYGRVSNKYDKDAKFQRYKLSDEAKILDAKTIEGVNELRKILGKEQIDRFTPNWHSVYGLLDGISKEEAQKIKDAGYDAVRMYESDRDTGMSSVEGDSIAIINPSIIKENPLEGKSVAEAYHKAKADGSNPELVKAVEQLLGKPQEKVEPPVKVKEEVVAEAPVSETKQAEPTKSIKDKFKDIADINLSDNPEVVKKREVTKYLKDNPEIADVVKNFEKVTEYLKSEKELKVICD